MLHLFLKGTLMTCTWATSTLRRMKRPVPELWPRSWGPGRLALGLVQTRDFLASAGPADLHWAGICTHVLKECCRLLFQSAGLTVRTQAHVYSPSSTISSMRTISFQMLRLQMSRPLL